MYAGHGCSCCWSPCASTLTTARLHGQSTSYLHKSLPCCYSPFFRHVDVSAAPGVLRSELFSYFGSKRAALTDVFQDLIPVFPTFILPHRTLLDLVTVVPLCLLLYDLTSLASLPCLKAL